MAQSRLLWLLKLLKTIETTLGGGRAVWAQDSWSNVVSVRHSCGLSAMPYSPLKEKALGVLRLLVISENDVRFRGEALIHNQIKAAVHEHPSSVSVFRASPRPRCRIKFALFRTAGALPLSNSRRKIRKITHYCQTVTQHRQGGGVAGFSHSPHFNIYCDHYHQVQIQIQSDRNPNPKCVPHCRLGLGVVLSSWRSCVLCLSLSPHIAPRPC